MLSSLIEFCKGIAQAMCIEAEKCLSSQHGLIAFVICMNSSLRSRNEPVDSLLTGELLLMRPYTAITMFFWYKKRTDNATHRQNLKASVRMCVNYI